MIVAALDIWSPEALQIHHGCHLNRSMR
jgi:hypothetical protein